MKHVYALFVRLQKLKKDEISWNKIYFHDRLKICDFRSTANQFIQQFLHVLLRPMMYIFHECLHNWLVYGRLMDPGFQVNFIFQLF